MIPKESLSAGVNFGVSALSSMYIIGSLCALAVGVVTIPLRYFVDVPAWPAVVAGMVGAGYVMALRAVTAVQKRSGGNIDCRTYQVDAVEPKT
jgi:hypothetical protein